MGVLQMSIYHVHHLGMDVQATLSNILMFLNLPILKSLGITQPILTPGNSGLGIKIKSSLSGAVPSSEKRKKKGPGLNTFPSTARTHSELPLSLFC